MGYLFLLGAIAAEITATLSIKASDGYSKIGFTILVVVGYIVAFTMLSFALQRGLPLGVAYGIWAAAGVAAVAVLSVPLFGESLTIVQGVGILFVIIGVLALELGASH